MRTRMSLSLVAYGESSGSESEPEEEVTSQPTKDDIRNLLSVLPRPKSSSGGGRRSRGPVRIGLPKVEGGEDSDEEDAPITKKSKYGGGVGLKALLPEPKGAPTQLGAPRKTATSSMVPYTLSKRRQVAIAAEKKATKKTAQRKVKGVRTGDDSDSDDEPVSFFPHLDSSRPNPTEVPQSVSTPDGTALTPVPSISQTTHVTPDNTTPDVRVNPAILPDRLPVAPAPPDGYQTSGEATGYQTSGEATGYQSTSNSHWHGGYQYSQQYGLTTPSNYDQYNDPSIQGYPREYGGNVQEYTNEYTEQHGGEPPEESGEGRDEAAMPGPGPGLTIDQEALRRLAGGKKRKGRDKGLYNIIEISEGEVKESIKTYQKYHTEDSVSQLYQASGKAPSAQQKRKHQLSYLAHQAKANELELRKHWGQANQTKRQTQMKYGF